MDLSRAVIDHVSTYVGDVDFTWHLETPGEVPIDIHHVAPSDELPCHTLVTSGMAEHPMSVPRQVPDADDYRYAELVLHLPPEWPLDDDSMRIPELAWPLSQLGRAARHPHRFETWLWGGHTISNGKPYACDTLLCYAWVMPLFFLPREFEVLRFEEREIVFLNLSFLYAEEQLFATERFSEGLTERMQQAGLSDWDMAVLNKNRKNACVP